MLGDFFCCQNMLETSKIRNIIVLISPKFKKNQNDDNSFIYQCPINCEIGLDLSKSDQNRGKYNNTVGKG